VTLIECDVGDAGAVGAMMERIGRELGGLDILVNNAGILRDRSLKRMAHEDWDAVLRVNLTGAFHCIQGALPLLRAGGRIVNVASLSGAVGIAGQANYAASKAGLMALTRVAATELAGRQVTVNAVAPGVVDTEMGRAIPEEARRQLLGHVPLGRFASAGEIAELVVFLCSGRAGYITGQTIHINGGMYMH
jgi:3-oxoacyl-[acyl-carrier protein] reductase